MERPVHPCPCEACRVGIGPTAEHHRRLNLILGRLDEPQRPRFRSVSIEPSSFVAAIR